MQSIGSWTWTEMVLDKVPTLFINVPGPSGYVDADGDCDDLDENVFPNIDADGDGYFACETVSTWNDCDDQKPSNLPFGTDLVGDGIDQNCDGTDSIYRSLRWKTEVVVLLMKIICWGESLELNHHLPIQWLDITSHTGNTGCFIDETQKMTAWRTSPSFDSQSISILC